MATPADEWARANRGRKPHQGADPMGDIPGRPMNPGAGQGRTRLEVAPLLVGLGHILVAYCICIPQSAHPLYTLADSL